MSFILDATCPFEDILLSHMSQHSLTFELGYVRHYAMEGSFLFAGTL